MTKILSFIVLFCQAGLLSSQNNEGFIIAEDFGASGARISLNSSNYYSSNPASFVLGPSQFSLFLSSVNLYETDLFVHNISMAKKVRERMGLFLSLRSAGIEEYRTNRFQLGYGIKLFPKQALAVQWAVSQLRIKEFDSEFGIHWQVNWRSNLSENVEIEVSGLGKSWNSSGANFRYAIGLVHRLSPAIKLFSEYYKDMEEKPGIAGGLIYRPINSLSLWLSFETKENRMGFAAQFMISSKSAIYCSVSSHPVLGNSFGLSFGFNY